MAEDLQLQKDSSPVLRNGMATPYIAVFNSQLAVIRDPLTGLPLGSLITHFEYTYEEEKVDTGKIEIYTNNPNLIALTELGYGMGLQLQWGYIYPDKTGYYGPVRKVIITDQEVHFGPEGIRIILTISDSSILLKNSPSNYYDNTKGFVKYVEDLCKGIPIGIALIDYNQKETYREVVAQRVVDAETISQNYKPNVNTGAEWAFENKLHAVSPNEMVQVPTTVVPDAVGVKFLEWNAETQQLVINDPDNFRKVYLNETLVSQGVVVGTSRNKYTQLQDICRSLNGGPYFVDSRDGQIVLHNVKSQRDITKVYTYMGGYGEMLEFTIKSSFIKTSTEVKQSTNIDPDTKSVETNFVQAVVDPNSGNPDGEGVDAFMIWPNLGTPFFNPRGGTTEYAPKSAAFQPIPGKLNQSSGKSEEYHVMMDSKEASIAVQAREEKPGTVERMFNSIREAKNYYTTHPEMVQQSEIDEYFNNWISDWNSKKTATDATDVENMSRHMDRIPPMVITRPIKIAYHIDFEELGGSLGLKNDQALAHVTPSFRNAVLSGQVDLNNYNHSVYSTPGGDGVRKASLIMGKTYQKNAEALLRSIPGIHILDNSIVNPEFPQSRVHTVILETDLKIEMNGIDVVSGAETINMPGFMGNDILEKVTNKVKAQSRVVGDPILESSMNIYIQNVSSKFTGLWYTKKVTHTIDANSGYICDIEFVQRTLPVSTVTLTSNWSKKDYGSKVLSAIKSAKEHPELYNIPSTIEKKVQQKLKDNPNKSVVSQVNPTTGKREISIYDMQSGTYIRKTDGTTIYKGSDLDNYLQDLQRNK